MRSTLFAIRRAETSRISIPITWGTKRRGTDSQRVPQGGEVIVPTRFQASQRTQAFVPDASPPALARWSRSPQTCFGRFSNIANGCRITRARSPRSWQPRFCQRTTRFASVPIIGVIPATSPNDEGRFSVFPKRLRTNGVVMAVNVEDCHPRSWSRLRELRLTFDWIICDSSVQEIENEAAVMTPKREIAICLVVASTLLSGGALAEGAGQDATTITANYGVYWAGLHFGEVRLVMTVRGSRYEMKGSGRFSVLGGLIYEWRGSTTSAGELTKTGPKPSLYTLNYSGADKHGDVRISFADGAVSDVSMSPKKRANPKNIPVTKDQLRGVLDPMTGAFLRARPDLTNADLKVCDETIPAFDGKLRFDIVLVPKQQRQVESKEPEGYSGPAAVCGVKFVPISGFRPGDRGINFMSSHADEIEVWLVPLYSTVMYLPYRISVPTAFGSGSAEMLSFQVTR